jgi:AcrR family transcriptional regulator
MKKSGGTPKRLCRLELWTNLTWQRGTRDGPQPVKQLRRTAALSKDINSAIAEFSLKGFDGPRVDELARRSGVNKILLYHHIGNKDRLFTAALEATYQSIHARQSEFLASQMDPKTGMRRLVHLLMSCGPQTSNSAACLRTKIFSAANMSRDRNSPAICIGSWPKA